MFDIGFWELSLIAVIALLILGPERLPRAARELGLWVGKLKKMVGEVKSNINEELRMEELNALKQAGQDLKDNLQSTQKELDSVEREIKQSTDEISDAAERVDITSAISSSAPVMEKTGAPENNTEPAVSSGSDEMPADSAPAPVQAATPVTGAKTVDVPAGTKGKTGKPKKTGTTDKKEKSRSKDKKPKKSDNKRKKAGA
ncbi:Sec-independent protein translocase protein TatB [Pseudomonadota bacterium]